MMRVAIYARFSSDKQSEASIPDQQRDCRKFVALREGWTVTAQYSDAAASGASLMRPGIQSLMRDARAGGFDVVLAESLDRFSRDQEDTAGLYKRLTYAGVRIVTLSEGDIGDLHVGLTGTMNALYLKNLAEKTRRGLRGRVAAGKSGGGNSYGYSVVRVLEGEPRGDRVIDPAQAAIVQRIFREFIAGASPKAIAKRLNAEGIPGPRGGAWSPNTLNGNVGLGTGILNNALYDGRLVWNRQRFLKDPDTGKRVPRRNAVEDVESTPVPHLRIVDPETWEATKARQAKTRHTMKPGIVHARRPKYLFSRLTKCAVCGGGFILSSRNDLRCYNHTERGTCSNSRTLKRQDLEARVLRAMREQFFEQGAFDAFCEGFTAELNRLRREHRVQLEAAPRELARINRRSNEILELLLQGFRDEQWKVELQQIEHRRAELTTAIAAGAIDPPKPALHPRMAEVFREKAEALAAALEHDEQHDAARLALRGFIDRIEIPPGDELLQVVGNLGEMLTAAGARNGSGPAAVGYGGCGGRI